MSVGDDRPIDPLRLAEKMHSARNFKNLALAEEFNQEPRFVEVLWALQFFSQYARPKAGRTGEFIGGYAGGLRAFTRDLIDDSRDLIGTLEMREIGDVYYDVEKARAVYNGIPLRNRAIAPEMAAWEVDAVLYKPTSRTMIVPAAEFIDDRSTSPSCRVSRRTTAAIVKQASREAFTTLCVDAAQESLADYLRALCEEPAVRFTRDSDADFQWSKGQAPWFFAEIGAALIRFIDRYQERVYRQIADTEVSRKVGKWLGVARATRRGVLISGSSRLGKTESVEAFCEAHPGRARLVQTPSSNSESELLRAVAKSLGMDISPSKRGYQLREQVNYLIAEAGLMLVFDEAQAIFPMSFGKNTPPARLNWIRRSVLDCGIPAGFVCTPQAYESARKKFLRTTNFAIEQWDERLLPTVYLPEEVDANDLLAIARIRFPGLHLNDLEYVVEAVRLKDRNFVSDVSRVADLARLNADEAGRAQPNMSDIKAAFADAFPATFGRVARPQVEAVDTRRRSGDREIRPVVPAAVPNRHGSVSVPTGAIA